MNILAAKSKLCILNVSPAGCGKSTATNTVHAMLRDMSTKYTSLTLASLHRRKGEFNGFTGHLVIDDLGGEKSLWSRLATVTVLANLVYGHYVQKITMSYDIKINDFFGSASLNIQPILMNSLCQSEDWIAVVRDKVLRYYHLMRPIKPNKQHIIPEIDWGTSIDKVTLPKKRGKLWWQLVTMGLTQWSHARCLEHLPALLKGCASLDGRDVVNSSDYRLLIKLLRPMQLERYIINTSGFEYGRWFESNLYCVLVEMISHKNCSIDIISEDYKISPETILNLLGGMDLWIRVQKGTPMIVKPTKKAAQILKLIGMNDRW